VLHLLPHWNWDDRLGRNVPVFCYTNYPKAELFVNGVSQGVREKNMNNRLERYRLMWKDVIYEPGEIRVVAMDASGNPVASETIKTASDPYSIRLTPDREVIRADGKDLSFVTVEVVDKDGNLCPRAGHLILFNLSGPGKLKAVCNGDPTDHTGFASNYMRVFNGKMIAVVESTREAGEITLEAGSSRHLQPAETMIVTRGD
jgi:beta-galactosidase